MQFPFISVSSNNNLVQVQDAANTKAENHLLCLQRIQLSFSLQRDFAIVAMLGHGNC